MDNMLNKIKVPIPEIEARDGLFHVRRYDITADEWVTDLDGGSLVAFDNHIRTYCEQLADSLIRWAAKRTVTKREMQTMQDDRNNAYVQTVDGQMVCLCQVDGNQ